MFVCLLKSCYNGLVHFSTFGLKSAELPYKSKFTFNLQAVETNFQVSIFIFTFKFSKVENKANRILFTGDYVVVTSALFMSENLGKVDVAQVSDVCVFKGFKSWYYCMSLGFLFF